ncbi:unnamed protein product [Meloidogyne enterolobii]|uniref:Uncharacterized protein n=1 Tax=Meloidogyne enterolobii TaxID=390850 RepID=A0ACB0ZJA2_MELEN
MPIKAMRQSLQNTWAGCNGNVTNPGCSKEATMLKCDKMFIRFDKEHFRILVPEVQVAEGKKEENGQNGTSTDGNKNLSVSTTQNMDTTSELVDTTTTNSIEVTRTSPTIDTKTSPATEPSKMSTTTIVFIISVIGFCKHCCCVLHFVSTKEGRKRTK